MIYFEFKIIEYFLVCIYCDSNKSWKIKDLNSYLEIKIIHYGVGKSRAKPGTSATCILILGLGWGFNYIVIIYSTSEFKTS